MENDLEGARTEYEKALEWGEKTSDEELMTRVDLSMALVSLEQRRIDEAQDWVEKAYKSARAIGSKKYEAESYAMRGRIQEKQKRYDFALQSYGLATFLFRQINDRYNMAKMEEAAGNIYMIQGDKERAIEYLRKAKAKYASLSYTDFRTIDEKLKKAEEI
jgi:tetratricopeptide (TPR) repeat protein